MLTIKTYLGTSEYSGIGVFANENIPEGKVIWEYLPLIDITYTQEEWDNLKLTLAGASFEMIQRYAYKENGCYVICTDNAQFMNHGVESSNIGNNKVLNSMFALRDIQYGEELICNYAEYSDQNDYHRQFLNV